MSGRFSDNIPGTWSSHPTALKRQRVWLFLLGLAPLIVLGVIGVVALTELDTWKAVVQHPVLLLKVIATAFCLSLGAILTLAMLNVVSRTMARTGRMAGRDELPFPTWVFVLGAFFWLVPLGLTFFREKFWDGPYFGVIQFLLNLLCFVPFVLILLWVLLARGKEELQGRERRSKLLGILWMFFVGLAVFSLLGDIHAALSQWNVSAEWVKGIHESILRLILFATLFPLAVVCFALWQLIRLPAKENKGKKEETTDESLGDDETVDQPPAWVNELCSNLPEGVRVEGGKAKLTPVPGTSPLLENAGEEFGLLMGGKHPTEDQYAFLERFKRTYRDALEEALGNGEPRPVSAKADVLLQGNPGSGRTEALCAGALYAALVRGQHVLYIVADNEQAKILRDRLDGRLRGMFLDCYVWCGVLTKLDADDWTTEKPSAPVPNILLATPETVEACFFSNSVTIERERLGRLRNVIISHAVVLVDDFMNLDVTGRSHLAFIIDKLRLLLVSEYILPQFVVAVPPLLEPEGVTHLGARLFGEKNFDNRNVFLLRPRECAPFWGLTLRVDKGGDTEGVCRELVRRCLERGLKVLLYRKGIGETLRQDLENDIRAHVKGGTLRVLSRLDGAAENGESPDAVFYLSVVSGNVTVVLRLALGDGQSVYIRIAGEGEADTKKEAVVPLIPDESALPLRVAHLRGVLGFIDPLTPIEATIWSHFGVSLTHPWLPEGKPTKGSVPLVSWAHDAWVEEDRYPGGQLWPYLVLDHVAAVSTRGQPVDLRVLPVSRDAIFRIPDAARLLLARLEDNAEDGKPHARQLAVWKEGRGNTLGEMDLAHADTLKTGDAGSVYVAETWRSPLKVEKERYAMAITGEPYRGDGSDYEIPIRRFAWRVPFAFRADTVWAIESLAGFELKHPNGDFCCVEATLDGAMNLYGEERSAPPMTYSYPAHLSGILLGQTLPGGEDSPGAVQNCLNGNWGTDMRLGFSPALTHALTAVLRRRFDGWSFFTLAPVFNISGREGSVGGAVLWLLEPVNSGHTVYPLLKRLLGKRDFMTAFLKDVLVELDGAADIKHLRFASRIAFKAEVFESQDIAASHELVKALLAGLPIRPPVPQGWEGEQPPLRRTYKEDYTEQEKEFDGVIVAGLLAFQDNIDVTKFAVEYGWIKDRIWDTLQDVLWNNPQLFFVSKYCIKWQWWQDATGTITRFLLLDFQYGIEKGDYAEKKSELDHEAAKALCKIEGITEVIERARVLHDHIVEVCDYDIVARDAKDASPLARTAYSVLVRHKAVCEGYTMGYRYLLNLAGIQSEELVGLADVPNPEPHAWNYLKIGEAWYHVDVTWDDPVYAGRKPAKDVISHEYFLLSDVAIRAKDHHDWNLRGLPPAENTQYDRLDWKGKGG